MQLRFEPCFHKEIIKNKNVLELVRKLYDNRNTVSDIIEKKAHFCNLKRVANNFKGEN